MICAGIKKNFKYCSVISDNVDDAKHFLEDCDEDDEFGGDDVMEYYEKNSLYKENALNYISGFVQRKILKNEKCSHCRQFLLSDSVKVSRSLLDIKTRGALMKPSLEVEYIVKVAENILSDLEKEEKFLQQKNISHVVFLKVFRYINMRKPNFIESFNFHDVTMSHKYLFIKKIVHFYVMIKLKHMAKMKNLSLSVKKIRHKFTKIVHFKNQ